MSVAARRYLLLAVFMFIWSVWDMFIEGNEFLALFDAICSHCLLVLYKHEIRAAK